jgi:hypothetical protein
VKKAFVLIFFWVLPLAAQNVNDQRFQLFQGKYVSASTILQCAGQRISDGVKPQFSMDTTLVLLKIDTQTGATWYLKSELFKVTTPDSTSGYSGFGWQPIDTYKIDSLSVKIYDIIGRQIINNMTPTKP